MPLWPFGRELCTAPLHSPALPKSPSLFPRIPCPPWGCFTVCLLAALHLTEVNDKALSAHAPQTTSHRPPPPRPSHSTIQALVRSPHQKIPKICLDAKSALFAKTTIDDIDQHQPTRIRQPRTQRQTLTQTTQDVSRIRLELAPSQLRQGCPRLVRKPRKQALSRRH